MAEQREIKADAGIQGLDVSALSSLAREGACLHDELQALGSFEKQVAAMQAMERDSKTDNALPKLQVTYDAEKHNGALKVGILLKSQDSFLSAGKLIYSATYNPQKQTIRTWCLNEK